MGIPAHPLFQNRREAGQKLAHALSDYAGRDDVIVLGLPRGGVPVALEVAKKLEAPLDVFLVRKLGVPGHRELAMGAIASGNVRVLNREIVDSLNISPATIDTVAEAERDELERRERAYRSGNDGHGLRRRIVILVDDGLATGATMRAAIDGVRAQEPKRIIVAVPVAAPQVCDALAPLVDKMVCLETPEDFMGVGAWYRDFGQTNDAEVQAALAEANQIAEG
jgi:putative phosphoribosyl transferase